MSIVLPRLIRTHTLEIDWDALYAEHVGRIFNFFRYRTGDEQVAHDLTATTFEKAWKRRKQYRGKPEAFISWLYAIARNVVSDHYRNQPKLVALDDVITLTDGEDVADIVAQKLEFGRLVQYIQRLSDRERDLITLKYGASLSNRQIARQLGLSESNVGSILHRTTHKLRQQMEQKS